MKSEIKIYKALSLEVYGLLLVVALFMSWLENGFKLDQNFVYQIIYWPIMALPFTGLFCKKVIETKESFTIYSMFGFLKKEFIKNTLNSEHSDKSLLVPGDCVHIVSNRHIKFQDEEKSCIIYPIGTAKFETLKIRLDKQKRTKRST
jgi:hypothetical protein